MTGEGGASEVLLQHVDCEGVWDGTGWNFECGVTVRDTGDLSAPSAHLAVAIEAFAEVRAQNALLGASAALRQAERSGYLFLDGSERVPWEAVARWLDDRARADR